MSTRARLASVGRVSCCHDQASKEAGSPVAAARASSMATACRARPRLRRLAVVSLGWPRARQPRLTGVRGKAGRRAGGMRRGARPHWLTSDVHPVRLDRRVALSRLTFGRVQQYLQRAGVGAGGLSSVAESRARAVRAIPVVNPRGSP